MKILEKLTKRERTLIIATVLLLVIASIGSLVILPLYSNMQTMEAELVDFETQKALLEAKLGAEDAYKESLAEAKASYNEIIDDYLEVMPNEDVDKILTSLCVENSLRPTMLGMREQLPTTEDGKIDEAAAASSGFVITLATMNLNGNYDNLKMLIESVEKVKSIDIRLMSMARNSSRENENKGEYNFSVTFEVKMAKDIA